MIKKTVQRNVVVVALCSLTFAEPALAEIVRVGLPGWRVDGHHTLTSVEIRRMDIATSVENATRRIRDEEAALRFAENFAEFIAADEIMRRDRLDKPLFCIRVTNGTETAELYLTVERGMTYQENMRRNGKPSATVTLWHCLPNGKFEEYCSRNFVPVKRSEAPEAVVRIRKLFDKSG